MSAASLPTQRPALDAAGSPTLADDRGFPYAAYATLWMSAVAGHTAIHGGGWVTDAQVWTLGAVAFGFAAVLTHRKALP